MSSEITEGSLYSGYGGLGMALRAVSGLPVRTLWHCDPDPDCDATLAKHHPGVPNLGSDTAPDWARVERPDVLDLGPPCQPVSAAGMGLGADDPRWRWPYAHVALLALRPPVIFFENVANLAAGKQLPLWHGILADMRAVGYQVAWVIIGACAIGAPHHRHRLFAVGRLRTNPGPAIRHGDRALCGTRAPLLPSPVARDGDPRQRGEGSAAYWARRQAERPTEGIPLGAAVRLLPGITAQLGRNGPGYVNNRGEPGLAGIAQLLPTPQARDGDPTRGAPRPDLAAARLDSGRRNLPDATALLPTPRASDAANGGPNQGITSGDVALSSAVIGERYGRYAPAVERWERLTGRPAPEPVEPTGRGGGFRLAPALPEWMMGLPDGHLTGHLGRPAALRLAGNGVCPQQAAAAFRLLWPLI